MEPAGFLGFEIWVEAGAGSDAGNTVLLRMPVPVPVPPSSSSSSIPSSLSTAILVRGGVLLRRDVICYLTADDCKVLLDEGKFYALKIVLLFSPSPPPPYQ